MTVRRRSSSAIALAVVTWSAAVASTRTVPPYEVGVFRWVNDREVRGEAALRLVMQAGSLGAVFALGTLARRWATRRGPGPILIGGTALWAGVKLLKVPIGRGRPSAYLDDVRVRGAEQTGLGYPSGHAAVATLLAVLATRPGTSRRVAVGVAGVTGLARVHVGAHLPLDVLGGLALGTLAADGIDALLDSFGERAASS